MNTEIEIEELQRQIELEPNNAKLLYKLSSLYNKIEDYQKSEEIAYKALEFEPENSDYLVSYGNALAWLGKYEEALEYISKGIEINKSTTSNDYGDGKDYVSRGNCYQRLNEKIISDGANENHEYFIKSLDDYTEAIKLKQENAQYYYCRGISYAWIGDFEKSHDDYKKAFELAPENDSYLSAFAITAKEIEIYFGFHSDMTFEEKLLNNSVDEKIKKIREKLVYLPVVRFYDDSKLKIYEICVSIDGRVILQKESFKENFANDFYAVIDYLEKIYSPNAAKSPCL